STSSSGATIRCASWATHRGRPGRSMSTPNDTCSTGRTSLRVPNHAIARTIGMARPHARPGRRQHSRGDDMTDDTSTKGTGAKSGAGSDDFAWTEPEPTSGDAGAKAREWVSQLQAMIENLATQATPVVKQIGAKAAELAALAGHKAGPVAQKAAEVTGEAGQKLAVKSREFATELRSDVASTKAGIEGGHASSGDRETPAGAA